MIGTLQDCTTKDQCVHFLSERSRNFAPIEYAVFAMNKLAPTNPFMQSDLYLLPLQRHNLLQMTPDAPWKAYCDILTLEQLHFVGW